MLTFPSETFSSHQEVAGKALELLSNSGWGGYCLELVSRHLQVMLLLCVNVMVTVCSPPPQRTIIFKNLRTAFKNSWVKVILNTQIQHISSFMHLIKQKLK